MYKKYVSLILIFVLLLSTVGCGGSTTKPTDTGAAPEQPTQPAATTSTEKIILKAGDVIDPNHPYSLGIVKFGEILKEKTNGRIEVQLFHSGQLGNERDLIEGVQMGSVEICAISSAPAAGIVPNIAVFDMPYLFESREQAYKVMDSQIGDDFFAQLKEQNVLGLGYWENGFRNITNSKRPINTPEDLVGLKIRVMENPVPIETFNTLGANATAMAWGEVFTALQQGTIDAQENPMSVIYLQRLFEVQKYLSMTEHFYAPALFLMSQQAYDKLSAEDQGFVMEAAAEATKFERQEAQRQAEAYVAKCEEEGMIINYVDKQLFVDVTAPVYDKFADQFGDLIDKIKATK